MHQGEFFDMIKRRGFNKSKIKSIEDFICYFTEGPYLESDFIDYDYDVNHPCQNGFDCCKNDYCRCGKIVNQKVNKIDLNFIK